MGAGAVVRFYLRTRVLILLSHQEWARSGAHPEGQLTAKTDGLEDRRNRRRDASDLIELRRHKNVTGKKKKKKKRTLLDLAGPPPCNSNPGSKAEVWVLLPSSKRGGLWLLAFVLRKAS